jgi:hypothetical protein
MNDNKKRFGLTALAIVLVIILLSSLFVYRHKKISNTSSSASSTDWLTYKNDGYGLELKYPQKWGSPVVKESPQEKGKNYSIVFSLGKNDQGVRREAFISIDSDDLSNKYCGGPNGECATVAGISKREILSTLDDKSGLFKYGNDSYSIIRSQPSQNMTTLSIYRMVNLLKIKASAIQATYSIFGGKAACPNNELSSDGQNCIDKNTYDTLNEVASSLK